MTTELLPPIKDSELTTLDRFIETVPSALTDNQLDIAFTQECAFTRKAQKRFRERTLPILMDVERRFAAGQHFCGFTGIESYYRSKGLNPATVRTWKRRARMLTDGNVPAKLIKSAMPEPSVEAHGFELDGAIWVGTEREYEDAYSAGYSLVRLYPWFAHDDVNGQHHEEGELYQLRMMLPEPDDMQNSVDHYEWAKIHLDDEDEIKRLREKIDNWPTFEGGYRKKKIIEKPLNHQEVLIWLEANGIDASKLKWKSAPVSERFHEGQWIVAEIERIDDLEACQLTSWFWHVPHKGETREAADAREAEHAARCAKELAASNAREAAE
jgi:hypothetical protein